MNKLSGNKVTMNAKSLSEKSRRSSPDRLTLKMEKKKVATAGSAFVALAASRDDREINGAVSSLANKTLTELKEKYGDFL